MMMNRTAIVDTVITVLALAVASWAGAKIFGPDSWSCQNNVMDYMASDLETKTCMYRQGLLIDLFLLFVCFSS